MYNINWKLMTLPLLLSCCLLSLTACTGKGRGKERRLRLATTTSTQNSGLLDILCPHFLKDTGISVDVISVGTGAALKLGERGDVDVVLVHARKLEDRFVAQGHGVNRRDVMYNDFVILGPSHDPAKIRGMKDVAKAMKKIAYHHAPFISRGDRSGTHIRELSLWRAAGIKPAPPWYVESGRSQGATQLIANEKRAYVLTDRGTALAFRDKMKLEVLCQEDPILRNPYGIIAINPKRFPKVNFAGAMKFIDFLTSPRGRTLIRNFGRKRFGRALFIPMTTGETKK